MTVTIGGVEYTPEELIELIAESDNDQSDDVGDSVLRTFSEVDGAVHTIDGMVHALEHRVTHLENRLPITHAGFGVSMTPGTTANTYRVQMLDYTGTPVVVQFEIPNM